MDCQYKEEIFQGKRYYLDKDLHVFKMHIRIEIFVNTLTYLFLICDVIYIYIRLNKIRYVFALHRFYKGNVVYTFSFFQFTIPLQSSGHFI